MWMGILRVPDQLNSIVSALHLLEPQYHLDKDTDNHQKE